MDYNPPLYKFINICVTGILWDHIIKLLAFLMNNLKNMILSS